MSMHIVSTWVSYVYHDKIKLGLKYYFSH